MPFRPFLCLGFLAALAACGTVAAPPQQSAADVAVSRGAIAKELFGTQNVASAQSAAPIGSYSKGCLAGGVQLPETGPGWQAMRLSRNRNWGHPALLAYLDRLSQKAARIPGYDGIYVGDMSQPRGGPMLTGHASHQTGLDADIWLRPGPMNLTRDAREALGATSYQRAKGAYVASNWGPAQHALIKAAAQDPAVARIFLFAGGKTQLCRDETGDRGWLRKVRPWWGHDDHIHVRLSCPPGAAGCVDQDPPPPGDGCDEAQGWVNNILNPPPPALDAPKRAPKRDLTLADLPAQCASVLSRR
ncbi:MAG: penicillin-insensitive murein endopeptidase [Tranquillimonas sp.]